MGKRRTAAEAEGTQGVASLIGRWEDSQEFAEELDRVVEERRRRVRVTPAAFPEDRQSGEAVANVRSEGGGRRQSALGPPALRVEGAVKCYGDTVALDGVSLTWQGGVLGLLGANGAGKTSLYRAILSLVELDAGRIEVDGLDARRQTLAVRRRIGYLPEEPELYGRLTGRELLRFVAAVKGLDNAGEREAMIEEWGLAAVAGDRLATYSLGMRKKVALAAALMGAPRLVLLDEPLNGLDAESMRRLRLRMAAMAGAGTAFVVSSHVMSFVERVCERVVVLRAGRVAAEGTVEELRRQAGMAHDPFEDVFLRLAVE